MTGPIAAHGALPAAPGYRRKEERRAVHMLAHFGRMAGRRTTVMLKDLTCGGTRIEGIGDLQEDEAVSITLPGCKPMLAFVAWAREHSAGLEFAVPLEAWLLEELVQAHAVGDGIDPPQPPQRRCAA